MKTCSPLVWPDQGNPFRPAERGFHRRPAAYHGMRHCRQAREEGLRMRLRRSRHGRHGRNGRHGHDVSPPSVSARHGNRLQGSPVFRGAFLYGGRRNLPFFCFSRMGNASLSEGGSRHSAGRDFRKMGRGCRRTGGKPGSGSARKKRKISREAGVALWFLLKIILLHQCDGMFTF